MEDNDMDRIATLVEGIGKLDPEKDYTGSGLPRVEALEVAAGIVDISGEERDKAWEIYEAQEPPEAPETTEEDASEGEGPEPAAGALPFVSEDPACPCYVIAEGKAITSRKGILGPGKEVRPEYLSGDGAAVLEDLVKKGMVIVK